MKNLRSPKIEMCNKKKLNEDDYILAREDETAILDIREKRGIKRHEGQEDDSGCLGTVRLVSSVSPQLVGCYGFDACLVSDQGRFDCHRVKLAAVSPVLKSVLKEQIDEDISFVYLPEYSNSEIFLLTRLLNGKVFEQTTLDEVPKLFKDLEINWRQINPLDSNNADNSSCYKETSIVSKTYRSSNSPLQDDQPLVIKMETDGLPLNDDDSSSEDDLSSGPGDGYEIRSDYEENKEKNIEEIEETKLSLENDCVPSEKAEFSCDICCKVSKTARNLKNHKKRAHSMQMLTCTFCTKLFSRPETLKRHLERSHHDEELEERSDKIYFTRFLRGGGYSSDSKEKSTNTHCCHLCQEPVHTFRKHFKAVHVVNNGNLQYVEEYKQFLRFNQLDFECNICNKTFQSLKNLNIHTRSKHTEYSGTFPCEFCGREFQQMVTLKKHIFNFHSENVPIIRAANISGEEKSYICDLCAKVFTCDEDLKIHMWIHSKSMKCRVENCFEEFPRKTAYVEHMLLRHKIVVKLNKRRLEPNNRVDPGLENTGENLFESHLCSECGDSFRNKKGLTDHTKSVHSREFICNICSQICKRKVALELHMAKHGAPTIKCDQCDKMFYTSYNMRRHMITMHVDNSQKPFKCNICPKGFESAKNLEGHLNMHSGLKPYICDICGKGFQNASNRRAHIKKLHQIHHV